MKTGSISLRSSSFSIFAISISLALLTASGLRAQTNTTWTGGTSNWNNTGNWSGGVVPSNGGTTFNVFIDGGDAGTNSAVTLDISSTINQLNIDAGDSLDILDNRILTIVNNGQLGSGQINNAGLISLSGQGNTTALRISGAVTLSGGGTVSMSGSNNSIDGSGQLTNVDNTISGTGNLGNNSISVINQGTVQAGTGESLTIDVANLGGGFISFDNQNLVLATGGGVVTLTGSGFGEFGGVGTYRAEAGSHLDLVTNVIVRNSTFDTTGNGEIRMVSGNNQTWDGVTNNGNVVRQDNGTLLVLNSLNNSGEISLTGSGNNTQLTFGSGTILSGGGSIVMSGTGANISGSGVTTNVDNTISGTGNLGNNSISMINQGTVQAGNGQSLTIDPLNQGGGNLSFDNQNLVLATGGGVVTLTGSGFGEFGGAGTYRAEAGSRIDLVTEAVVRNTNFATTGDGEIRMASGHNQTWDSVTSSGNVLRQDNGTLAIQNTLTNSGQISVIGAGNLTLLSFNGNVNLSGGGDIVLAGSSVITGSGILTNADNTISGSGNFGNNSISVVNQGIVQAGSSQTMTIDPRNAGGGNISFDNQNLVLATGGGVVTLTGANFGEFGGVGTYRAEAGSRIDLVISAIARNTTFETTGNGEIRMASGSNQLWDGVTSTGNVVRQDNGTLAIQNTLINSGQISVIGQGNTTQLSFDGNVNLSGGGNIVLDGNAVITGSGILTNADNTISGNGNFGNNSISVVNQGIVQAGANQTMTIDPRNAGGGNLSFDNQNLVLATGGGVVTLSGANFGEFGGAGTYRAEGGSRIDLVISAIARNTTFETTGNGEIRMASGSNQLWDGVTSTGNVVRQDNGTLAIQNTLINSGQISVTGQGNTTRLSFDGNVNLSGGGNIVLDGNAVITGSGILTNADNTISGSGNFGNNSISVINQGIVQAGGGQNIVIDPRNAGGGNAAFDNQNLLRAEGGGVVSLTGANFGEFGGSGTFEAINGTMQFDTSAIVQNISGGTLNSGTWRSIFFGTISVDNPTTSTISTIGAAATVELRGPGTEFRVHGNSIDSTLTANAGSLIVGAGRVLNTSAGLSNTGSVEIDGSASSINVLGSYQQTGATAVTRLLNNGTLTVDMAAQLLFDTGSLTGNGDLVGDSNFAAASTIAPGLSTGILDMAGDTEFDGTLQFELMADLVNGVAQDAAIVNRGFDATMIGFDQINVFGTANLDGTMQLDVVPGFIPMVGDFFDLITADVLTLQPTFSIVGSGSFTYDWSVLTLPDPQSGGSNRDVLRAVVLTSSIPEPGSLSLLFACSVFGLMRRRRRS